MTAEDRERLRSLFTAELTTPRKYPDPKPNISVGDMADRLVEIADETIVDRLL